MSRDPLAPYTIESFLRDVSRSGGRALNAVRYLAGADFGTQSLTPREAIWNQGKVQLWRYRSEQPVTHGPPVLMFIGLASRSYVYDLHPRASMVRSFLAAGFDVYVLDWGVPGPEDASNTLETYATRYLPRAIRAVLRSSVAEEVSLLGFCMGGNLALLALAADPGLPVRNLITMATPIDFDEVGIPQMESLRTLTSVKSFLNDDGMVPARTMATLFRLTQPTAIAVQSVNLWEKLDNDSSVHAHRAVARWSADHVPFAGAAAEQVLTSWVKGNAFLRNTLTVLGRPVDLRDVRCNMLGVLTTHDEIVPPDSARPIADVVGSSDIELLEVKSGHIGLVVGRSASKVAHPQAVEWLGRHSDDLPIAHH